MKRTIVAGKMVAFVCMHAFTGWHRKTDIGHCWSKKCQIFYVVV